MPKRDLSKSRKLPAVDTAAHDAETVRLVREWADSQGTLGQIFGDLIDRFDMREVRGMQGMRERCAHEVFAILNRKPAAKARTRAGGK
jgi:hypothetical protein